MMMVDWVWRFVNYFVLYWFTNKISENTSTWKTIFQPKRTNFLKNDQILIPIFPTLLLTVQTFPLYILHNSPFLNILISPFLPLLPLLGCNSQMDHSHKLAISPNKRIVPLETPSEIQLFQRDYALRYWGQLYYQNMFVEELWQVYLGFLMSFYCCFGWISFKLSG